MAKCHWSVGTVGNWTGSLLCILRCVEIKTFGTGPPTSSNTPVTGCGAVLTLPSGAETLPLYPYFVGVGVPKTFGVSCQNVWLNSFLRVIQVVTSTFCNLKSFICYVRFEEAFPVIWREIHVKPSFLWPNTCPTTTQHTVKQCLRDGH